MLIRYSRRLFTALLVVFLTSTASGENRFVLPDRPPRRESRYQEITDGRMIAITAMEWAHNAGLTLLSESSDGTRHTVLVGRSLQTLGWRYESPETDTEIEAVLTADRAVQLTGALEGEPLDATVRLTEDVWIQSIERSLEPLAVSGDPGETIRFSVVQPDTLSSRTLQATVMSRERIEVNGEETDTRRIRISLPGLGVLLWRSDYWFRVSDGLFVKSNVTRGPPGTPATIVTLLETEP